MPRRFTLKKGHWYAWQMIPGYAEEHYYSPILVRSAEPLQTGNSILRLAYYNAAYAEGVRNFDGEQLHILLRAGDYLIAARLEGQSPEETRSVIISPLGMRWLQIFFPEFMTNNPPTAEEERDTQAFLNRLFEAGVF